MKDGRSGSYNAQPIPNIKILTKLKKISCKRRKNPIGFKTDPETNHHSYANED